MLIKENEMLPEGKAYKDTTTGITYVPNMYSILFLLQSHRSDSFEERLESAVSFAKNKLNNYIEELVRQKTYALKKKYGL